jgi:enolase
VEEGLKNNWANSLLLKVNQIGTISESIISANKMLHNDKVVIVSHRSGETNHAFIIDIAVGIGAQYVKIGGLCRGERIEKYNRLLEINDIISSEK